MHLNKYISRSQYLKKYLTYEAHIFFRNIENLIQIPKMQNKSCKKFTIF